MKNTYVKKIGNLDGIDFWLVDGFWIRGNIEEEFTNCADNFNFKFIPKNEVWIDKDNNKNEIKYFIKFYTMKKKFLDMGKKYKDVIRLAEAEEKKERLKSDKAKKLLGKSKKAIIEKIHKKLLKKYSNNKIKIWVVDGFLVRSLFFLDFTHGGHDLVYKFVPKNEVWIDDVTSLKDLKYVLIHELHERRLMKKGMKYNNAHYNFASKIELYLRKHPKKINEILKKEIKNQ